MSRWRIAIVVGLLLTPAVGLMGFGTWSLWERGLFFWVWWPMAASVALAWGLAWYWQRQRSLIRDLPTDPEMYWTERDQQAWAIVCQRAEKPEGIRPEQLTDPRLYMQTAEQLALQIARFYHPDAVDPLENLTIPEMLAVAELAAEELSDMVRTYVPGGHLLTIKNFKQARKALDWYDKASDAWWVIATVLNPAETLARYAATKLGVGTPLAKLQQNLQLWFYTAYVHRLGKYLIELNSGRLRVGAKRYRELTRRGTASAVRALTVPAETNGSASEHPPPAASAQAVPEADVTLLLMGQVKMGKSSLVNALLGAQHAQTDVLPATEAIARYRLHTNGIASQVMLLDTVGYGHAGPREDQMRATEQAARESDLLLMVLHATNPGRAVDVAFLDRLRDWFATQPHLKMPPVLGVLTHIDLLSPSLEWSPPYDPRQPRRPKEQSIRAALDTVREQFGSRLVEVVPVCAAAGREYGLREEVIPAIARHLDEAHAVGMLRCLFAEADTDQLRRIFDQIRSAAPQIARAVWESLGRK